MATKAQVFKLYERGTRESYRQDAHLAMGGKVENAAIELLTNADDSYEVLEGKGQPSEGRIRIEIERRKKTASIVRVADRAEGMSRDEMVERLTRPGLNTSGRSKGSNVRGCLGRGAKDIAYFGAATFECIKDDRYACLEINKYGEGRFRADARGRDSLQCPTEIRERLGIARAKTGTVVTVSVESLPVHQFAWWHTTFRKHFQLRDILADPRRQIEVVDKMTGRSEKLHYRYPEGEVIFDKVLDVAGYPNARTHLTVSEHRQGKTRPVRMMSSSLHIGKQESS